MSFRKIDIIEESLNTGISLLKEGKTEEVIALMESFKPMVLEERRRVIKEDDKSYEYTCKGCSFACTAGGPFEPNAEFLKYCKLDGTFEANYVQTNIVTTTKNGK